jgi:bifunctional non-homologous end joining protein LigD
LSLEEYGSKREFNKTPEPRGKTKELGKELVYVIQKHQARHLHWDLRLERGGVL